MRRPHWLEICKGPVVKVEHVSIDTARGVDAVEKIGWNTKQICRCSSCGKIFLASTVPGKWSLEELKGD